MDENTRISLMEKKEKIISMVIQRARRDFRDDIAIIGLTGSFSTGDFHEKSDIDLIIINNTEHGWEIASCFILEDVGYDIYCTPWETRIEAQASLNSPMVSCLVDLQILYCAKPEYMEKFNAYKQRAQEALAKPIGNECIGRAQKYMALAKQEYTNALLSEDIGTVRFSASKVLYSLINALINLNNTYFKRGIKRYMEQMASLQYMPEDFDKLYIAVIDAKTVDDIRKAAYEILKSTAGLYDMLYDKFTQRPVPTYDNLCGTYEELWCNCRNKIIASTESKDKSYAYHAARGAQEYLDEMTEAKGTPKFDLMKYFDSDNLLSFKEEFLRIMDEYLEEYNKVGRKVERYDSFQQLYDSYMQV